MRSSIKDGMCWAAMFGLAENYAVPFAINLGASSFVIGVLRSLPVFISSIVQIFTELFVYYFNSCKKVVFWSVFLQAFSLLFASISAFIPTKYAVWFFLLFMISYSSFGALSSAPWFTLMGEYLPSNSRGRFFGFRNRLIAISFFSAGFIASVFLNYYGKNIMAFSIIFLCAAIFRFASAHYITFMYESHKKFHIPKTFSGLFLPFSFKEENKQFRAIFMAIFLLLSSTYIAAPYFSIYILKDLKFDYVRYLILSSIGQFLIWFLAKNWGEILDRRGSLFVLKYAFILIPVVSLLWLLNRNFYYLLAVEIFSGIAWGAYAVGSTTIVYEYIEPSLRTRYNSLLIFFTSSAQFFGSLIGGILYDYLEQFYSHPFIFILGISTLGRFLALYRFKNIQDK